MEHLQGALYERARELIDAGRTLYARGWVPATSGNFSARLDGTRIAVTVSGRHKGQLGEQDLMVVGTNGTPLTAGRTPSAETPLHLSLYRRLPDVGAVLHTHSVNATVLSRHARTVLELVDYELLKAFTGVKTHAGTLKVPVFANDQDVGRLAAQVEAYMDAHDAVYGYLIEGHGLYTWGYNVADAMRHLEAFEFLFECEMRTRGMHQS